MTAILISLLLLLSPAAESDSVDVTTGIDGVTVFKNQAQIERSAEVNLNKGSTTVVFENLSPSLINESIQLKGSGAYTLLSLTTRFDYTEKTIWREDIQQLRDRRDRLQNELTAKQAEQEVIKSEISMLNSTQNIINNNKLSSVEISQLLTLYRQNLSELLTKRNAVNKEIQTLMEQIQLVNKQINESGIVKRNRYSQVIAEISSELSQTLTFELSYLVNNAGWTPSYDLRSDDTDSPLSITYKAGIYQNTGIDWNNVKFTINSGDPSSNSTKPELNTSYVGYFSPYVQNRPSSSIRFSPTSEPGVVRGSVIDKQTGESLPGVSVTIPQLNRGAGTDSYGNFRITNVPSGSYTLNVAYVGYATASSRFSISNNGVSALASLEYDTMALDEVVVSAYSPKTENESIRLRASDSVKGASEPVYIINGVVAKDKSVFESLSPDDIESMEVLSGQEAQALYGSTAPGGVIVITTRNTVSAGMVSNQTSFSYEIDIPYSVPSDGKEHTVEIKKEEAVTEYQLNTVPKLSEFAYLVGQLPEWNSLNLLPGEASIYFDNSFVGTTFLNPISLQDTLSISLGKDERIVIERKKLNEFTSKNFFRSRVRENHSFEISIRNSRDEAVTIQVEDQIPVSTNEEIKVSPKELSGGILNEETGLISWEVEIQPGMTRTLRLDFEVEYPKGKQINF